MNLRRLQWKRTGKGRRGLLVAALLLAVCTVFVLARRAMMNTLLRHATRYAEVGEWSRVFLLSDHEALVLLPPYSEALRVDIRTGRKEPIAPLSSLLRKVPVGSPVLISRDTKWLWWDGWPHPLITSSNPLREIITLDGSKQWQGFEDFWPLQRPKPFWTPDSRCLMYIKREEDNFELTYTSRNSAQEQRINIKIPPGSPLALGQQYKDFGNSAADVEAIGWTSVHHLLTASWAEPPATSLTFYELDTDKQANRVRWWNVKPPQDRHAEKILLSPQGDRLAWQVGSDWEDAGSSPLRRLADRWPMLRRYPMFNPQSCRKMSLYTSRLDGSDRRDLGSIEQYNDPMSFSVTTWLKQSLENLQWTPDGTRLLFVYDGAIYTVPAQ